MEDESKLEESTVSPREVSYTDLERLTWVVFRLGDRLSDLEMLLSHLAQNPLAKDLIAESLASMENEKVSRALKLMTFQYNKTKEIEAPDFIIEEKEAPMRFIVDLESRLASLSPAERLQKWFDERLDYQGESLLSSSTGLAMWPDSDSTIPTIEEIVPSGIYEADLADRLYGHSLNREETADKDGAN